MTLSTNANRQSLAGATIYRNERCILRES